jgi:hypothetical protein
VLDADVKFVRVPVSGRVLEALGRGVSDALGVFAAVGSGGRRMGGWKGFGNSDWALGDSAPETTEEMMRRIRSNSLRVFFDCWVVPFRR